MNWAAWAIAALRAMAAIAQLRRATEPSFPLALGGGSSCCTEDEADARFILDIEEE